MAAATDKKQSNPVEDLVKLIDAENKIKERSSLDLQETMQMEQQSNLINDENQLRQQKLLDSISKDVNKDTVFDFSDLVKGAGDVVGNIGGFAGDVAGNIGDALPGAIEGLRQNVGQFKDGETTPFFDLLRSAAANYAPEQSAVFEKQVADQATKFKASQELLNKLMEKRTPKLSTTFTTGDNKEVFETQTGFVDKAGNPISTKDLVRIATKTDKKISNPTQMSSKAQTLFIALADKSLEPVPKQTRINQIRALTPEQLTEVLGITEEERTYIINSIERRECTQPTYRRYNA